MSCNLFTRNQLKLALKDLKLLTWALQKLDMNWIQGYSMGKCGRHNFGLFQKRQCNNISQFVSFRYSPIIWTTHLNIQGLGFRHSFECHKVAIWQVFWNKITNWAFVIFLGKTTFYFNHSGWMDQFKGFF